MSTMSKPLNKRWIVSLLPDRKVSWADSRSIEPIQLGTVRMPNRKTPLTETINGAGTEKRPAEFRCQNSTHVF